MNKFRKFSYLFLLILSIVSISGCNKQEQVNEPKPSKNLTPSINVSENDFDFVITDISNLSKEDTMGQVSYLDALYTIENPTDLYYTDLPISVALVDENGVRSDTYNSVYYLTLAPHSKGQFIFHNNIELLNLDTVSDECEVEEWASCGPRTPSPITPKAVDIQILNQELMPKNYKGSISDEYLNEFITTCVSKEPNQFIGYYNNQIDLSGLNYSLSNGNTQFNINGNINLSPSYPENYTAPNIEFVMVKDGLYMLYYAPTSTEDNNQAPLIPSDPNSLTRTYTQSIPLDADAKVNNLDETQISACLQTVYMAPLAHQPLLIETDGHYYKNDQKPVQY